MRRHAALLGARPPPILLFLLPFLTIFSLFPNYCQSMKFDAERIAARLKIDEKWDQLEAFQFDKSKPRKGRQIQPKEISIQVTAPLFSSRLFDYGTQAGDAELPQALDVGKKLDLVNPISFFGNDYKTIYILSNGAVGFEAGSRSYKSGVLPGSTRLLAPFWNRNDLRNGGKVYYREVTKGRVLERGQSEIRYQYDKNVKVKSALIITWDKMQPLNTAALPEENTNTFQAAIFITGNGTFANFIYSNVGWTQGAEAGFNAGDATNHFKLPTSGTPNIMYLEEYGNTGIPGEWMFELSDLRVISCKSGIKGDTCDQECTTGEWGPDCAYCCHCSEGTCHPITGDCARGCATCWDGPACQTRQDKCATRTQCASNALSFNDYDRCGEPIQRCQCLNGYKGDGYLNCEDINECSSNSTICHRDAVCTNTPGRYFCQCKEGFSGDGQTECSQSFLYQYDNHKQLARKKNSKMEWKLKQPMKIFGEIVDKVIITSNGLIAIDEIHPDNAGRLEEMQLVGIAPFLAPFDISKTGSISVEEVNDVEVLRRLTRTIAENYNDPTFNAKNALIATFSNVTDGRQSKGNTFQALLIDGSGSRGEKMSFAQIMYRDLPWGNGEAGILSRDSSSSILLPASGTEAISQLVKLSNIKQPGTWLFRIDRPQLTPCAQAIQVPPYCDHLLNNNPSTTSNKPRLPSKILEEKKEDLTLPKPGAFLIDQPSETIRPTFVKPSNRQPSNDRNVITVTSASITNVQQHRPTAKTTQRPRPNFSSSSGSTPHRPIVSLSDEDFEIGPDAFEVTFPPFVTVVPELFPPKEKSKEFVGRLSTQRPLPDFSIKTPLKEKDPDLSTVSTSTTRRVTTPTVTTRKPQSREDMSENEESPFEGSEHSFKGESVIFTDELDALEHSFENRNQNQKEESKEKLGDAEIVEATEEPSTMKTTTDAPTTTTMMKTTTTTTESVETTKEKIEQQQPSIFVFTTQKPSTNSRRITQQSIVTAPIPVQKHHPNININHQNDNELNTNSIEQTHTEEQSERKLAIILPVMIILAWMAILVCIAGIVCCKRRSSRESSQLRAMYGAAYGVRPTSFEAKRKETSYEDHLERAARLGGGGTQTTLSTQQAGKISLYGSYWNLQPIQSNHSPAARLSTQERQSPPTNFINNGYTNPTRFTYAGHY